MLAHSSVILMCSPITYSLYLPPPGNFTLSYVLDNSEQAASNPNPINYYLEAGDYVFIVFGSILCGALVFVVVLGYCIHPFFLA